MKKGEMLERVYKSNLPSRAKQIIFYLINRANNEGTCFPSIKTIARDCGVSQRTVQRTMKILVENGFIKKDNRYREKGGQTSNLYTLVLNDKGDKDVAEIEKSEITRNDNNDSVESVNFDYYTNKQPMDRKSIKKVNETAGVVIDKEYIAISEKYCLKFFKQKGRILQFLFAKYLENLTKCHRVGDNLKPP